ncbi:MAG TPA: hypothetical protein VLL98_06085 [Rickettsiales bacterium]|nr:hypothetical protein [Rickettsiales bacterium]
MFFIKKFLTFFVCWFIPNKVNRKAFRRKMMSVVITNTNIKNRNKPVEPWAFIRVKNEIKTLEACLNSILPAIKKGVIAFNDCDDGTEEYILEFCRLNKGFIPYKSPYTIFPLNDPRNFEEGHNESKINEYYNAALKLLPQNEWLIKIDADQTYEADKLKKMFFLPRNEKDAIVFGILNLHYDGKDIYFIKNFPYLINADHWLIFNKKLHFSLNKNKSKNSVVEHLNISKNNIVFSEVCSYHFPMIKKFLNKEDYKYLAKLEGDSFSKTLNEFVKKNKLPFVLDKKLLNKNHILKFCKDFNLKGKRILPKK